jgi:predicted  nucleic acid-binding Zn-ribbon protein
MKEIIENLFALQALEFRARPSRSTSRAAQIEALRKEIPAPILGHYDRMLARDKKGVSVVHHGVCSECHIKVPVGSLVTVARGEDVQLCGNCGRYLYLPSDEPIQSGAVSASTAGGHGQELAGTGAR